MLLPCLPSQNEVEMFVVPDPKYRRLVEVLSPEESERVLMFLNTFNAVSSAKDHIVLRSGYSRPQRTKVSASMSRHTCGGQPPYPGIGPVCYHYLL